MLTLAQKHGPEKAKLSFQLPEQSHNESPSSKHLQDDYPATSAPSSACFHDILQDEQAFYVRLFLPFLDYSNEAVQQSIQLKPRCIEITNMPYVISMAFSFHQSRNIALVSNRLGEQADFYNDSTACSVQH